MIALVDNGDLLQLIHDLIHLPLHRPWKVPVGSLSFNLTQLLGQLPDHLLRPGVLAHRLPHLPGQLQHDFPGLFHQLISGNGLLFVDVEQFLLEDIVGELRLHLTDAIPVQVCLSRFHRPGHHVDVRMVTFIMERRVPPEVLRRNMHGCRDVVAVRAEQGPPCLRVVVAQGLRVLPVQRQDVCPDISGVVLQLRHSGVQIHMIRVAEQTVIP